VRLADSLPRETSGEDGEIMENGIDPCEQGNSIFVVEDQEGGRRLDVCLVAKFPDMSRSGLGRLIRSGHVTVKGEIVKAGYLVRPGDLIELAFPSSSNSSPTLTPQQVDFSIVYEDESILVLAKPPGLVVHPGAGNEEGTLAHGVLFHCGELPFLDEGRPGIVHRLDKDTSGVMLVAKNENSLRRLTKDFHDRKVEKKYTALLLRCPKSESGRMINSIGRHPANRKKMAVLEEGGRYAASAWKVTEKFSGGLCLADIAIETGRTHQIRVHMSFLGCPVLGDNLYGGRSPSHLASLVHRQMLHASTISFIHPESLQRMSFTVPLWSDMKDLLGYLRQ